MGYNPGISYHGDQFIAAAGQQMATSLASWLKESRDEQKQKEFNVGLATELAHAGKITPEDLQKFLTLNPDKQGGILTGIARNETERQQQQRLGFEEKRVGFEGQRIGLDREKMNLEDWNAGADRDSRVAVARIGADSRVDAADLRGRNGRDVGNQADPITDSQTGEPIPGAYRMGNHIITNPIAREAAKPDTFEQLDKDIYAATHARFGDWENATNKRVDPKTGELVADFPSQKMPDRQNPGKTIDIPGTTRAMPWDLYLQSIERKNAILANKGKKGPASTNERPLQTTGGASYPDGTRVRRGEKWFVYKNGQPVPVQ